MQMFEPADNIDPFSGMPRSVKLRVPQCGGSRDMEAPAFEVPPSPGGPMVLSVERVPPNTQVEELPDGYIWETPVLAEVVADVGVGGGGEN